MRIISGELKGRKLIDSSHLKDLRPTTDRNREALFNILNSAKSLREIAFSIEDLSVLDICCGTGAVAFEALSRGAKNALLIDKNFKHLEVAKENAKNLALENKTEFLLTDVEKLALAKKTYDLIYIDPPYSIDAKNIVKNLLERNWVHEKSLIIIESAKEINYEECGLRMLDSRKYGISRFQFFMLK